MPLTIAYITSRNEPKFDWFIDSLDRELRSEGGGEISLNGKLRIVVVDFHGRRPIHEESSGAWFHHVPPKPTPWQGKYRLTDHDAFAASNARNTALCLAPDGYIVFIDDVSVLVNGWLSAVRESMDANRIVCGAYRKVKELAVDSKGNITHWLDHPGGQDTRWKEGRTEPVECISEWLYGCSFGAPVETLLEVNGFDECLDGLSFEDVCLGLRLAKADHKLWYDQRMLTFESDEAHHGEGAKFQRHNRPIEGYADCAWEMLDWIKKNPPQSRGTPDLRAIRADVLAGKPFPMHTGFFVWPDGKNLLGK